jgi:hypothetical protein
MERWEQCLRKLIGILIEHGRANYTSDTRRAQGDDTRSVIADCRGPKLELRCDDSHMMCLV